MVHDRNPRSRHVASFFRWLGGDARRPRTV